MPPDNEGYQLVKKQDRFNYLLMQCKSHSVLVNACRLSCGHQQVTTRRSSRMLELTAIDGCSGTVPIYPCQAMVTLSDCASLQGNDISQVATSREQESW